MTPELTSEQGQAIDEQKGQPVYVVDADRRETFVLLSSSGFDKVRPMLASERDDGPWTDEKDRRRVELIDKKCYSPQPKVLSHWLPPGNALSCRLCRAEEGQEPRLQGEFPEPGNESMSFDNCLLQRLTSKSFCVGFWKSRRCVNGRSSAVFANR